MDLGLEDRSVLVAGGTRGIGRACVVRFLDEGCVVTAVGHGRVTVQRLLDELAAGDRLHGIEADLLEQGEAERCVTEAVIRFGAVDCLVNSAGAVPAAQLADLTVDWGEIFTKFSAYLAMVSAVMPHMIERRTGAIINLVGSEGVRPLPWSLPSVANNSALNAVTRAIAQQVAPLGIRINAVNPGPTDTDRWHGLVDQWANLWDDKPDRVAQRLLGTLPTGRLITPDEIAALVVFLASELSGSILGEAITADALQRRDELAVDPMRHQEAVW